MQTTAAVHPRGPSSKISNAHVLSVGWDEVPPGAALGVGSGGTHVPAYATNSSSTYHSRLNNLQQLHRRAPFDHDPRRPPINALAIGRLGQSPTRSHVQF